MINTDTLNSKDREKTLSLKFKGELKTVKNNKFIQIATYILGCTALATSFFLIFVEVLRW
jgi:hypothetical protein